MPAEVRQLTGVLVHTKEGFNILTLVLEPNELATIEITIRDHFNRTQVATVNQSTQIVLLPFGEIGELVFDPTRRQLEDGTWEFMLRPVLAMSDVLDGLAAHAAQQSAVVPASSMDVDRMVRRGLHRV